MAEQLILEKKTLDLTAEQLILEEKMLDLKGGF